MNRLHRRLAKQPFTEQALFDYETILKAISAWIKTEQAVIISKSLDEYFVNSNTKATALRVSVLFPFPNDDRSWPVVEWKQDNDKDILAIFHFDENSGRPGRYSWLVHCGTGPVSDESRWEETVIAWGVIDMSHLKTLFGAAQHFLGILDMPPADATRLYCEIEPTDCSKEE